MAFVRFDDHDINTDHITSMRETPLPGGMVRLEVTMANGKTYREAFTRGEKKLAETKAALSGK